MLALHLAPMVSASSDGIVINLEETVISGDEEIGSGAIDISLNLTAVSGTAQQVTWNASLHTIEGVLIDSSEGISTLSSGESETVQVTLSSAPLGHSVLNISLQGDLGVLGANQAHYLEEQIQRLRPMDIALGSTTQWIVDPVDSNSQPTGNTTLRQGDAANLSIPVINDGDLNWTGSISAELDGQPLLTSSLEVEKDSTHMFAISIPAPLSEGEHTVWVNLSGMVDSNPSDESAFLEFSVGPPPLAELHLSLQRGTLADAGEVQQWNLSISNTGEVSWSGTLSCTFAASSIFEQEVIIVSQYTVQVSTTARPGLLECQLSGERTHSSSQLSIQDDYDIPAASFVASGVSQPALSGGPWHIDDRITASLLIRNTGDEEGSVSLELGIGDETSSSNPITLGPGDAKELSHFITPTSSGDSNLEWRVISQDGGVDSVLVGQIPLIISNSQTLSVEIVAFDEELDWNLELGDGVGRDVEVSAGWIVEGSEYMVYHSVLFISPGSFSMDADIGQRSDSEGVFVRVSTVGWSAGSGQVQSSLAITDASAEAVILLNPITNPRPAVAGEQASVEVSLKNVGDADLGQGKVILFDGKGVILSSFDSDLLTPQQEVTKNIDLVWPEGSTVTLNARWFVDGKAVSSSESYSVPSDDSTSQQLDLPWMSMLTGLGIAAAIIFVLRLFRETEEEEENQTKTSDSTKPTEEVEKVEISCPECERSLRVPTTHSGKVRCPECSTSFSAKQPEEDVPEPVEEEEKELTASSTNDNLACPKCARTLRVPVDRRPAKARCPACETIFRALKG